MKVDRRGLEEFIILKKAPIPLPLVHECWNEGNQDLTLRFPHLATSQPPGRGAMILPAEFAGYLRFGQGASEDQLTRSGTRQVCSSTEWSNPGTPFRAVCGAQTRDPVVHVAQHFRLGVQDR